MVFVNSRLCISFVPLIIVSFLCAVDTYEVRDEIEKLKETDTYIKTRLNIEDENIKNMLDSVQRAKFAANSTESKWLKQFFLNYLIPGFFKDKGIVGIEETQAPKLHAMLKEVSDKLKMPKPFIFAFFDEKYYNAAAISLSPNAALIFIGEGLLKGMNDDQLKAILAHELGHIYHNHVPKRLLYIASLAANSYVFLISMLATFATLEKNRLTPCSKKLLTFTGASLLLEILLVYLMPKFFRTQEREADDIARTLVSAEIFSDTMQMLKNYTLTKQDEFKKACEFLNQNIQELEKVSPSMAGQIKDSAKVYQDAVENFYQSAVKDGSDTHPALDERIVVKLEAGA
jgi:Zn-dependent protease with chaperone function